VIRRTVEPADIDSLVPLLRKGDLLDIIAVTNLSPKAALSHSVATSSRAFAIEVDGACIAIGGIQATTAPRMGSIWLIGSEPFDIALRRGGIKFCKPWFVEYSSGWDVLFNIIPELNRRDLRWLEWMGFKPVKRFENFRGRGYDCIQMNWTR
jgi:hypothetical protein